MSKKTLLIPIGRSPAIATEMVRYLEPEGITDLILLPTRDDYVLAGARLVEAAIKVNYPNIRVHMAIINVSDVVSEEDTLEVMKIVAKEICKERLQYGVDYLYLSIAGGRKETTVTTAIIGLAFGITAIYHVINKEVKSYNEYQEKIKSEIMWFLETDINKRIEKYREKRELFDHLLFPDGTGLEYIKLPLIPYPPEYISFLKRALKRGGIYYDEEKVEPGVIPMLKRCGLIADNEYRAWPTELGIEIGKILRCEV